MLRTTQEIDKERRCFTCKGLLEIERELMQSYYICKRCGVRMLERRKT